MKADRKYDLVVIGGGTGGLVSSMIAAKIGARVALIEREHTGGDCLWTGCVPSKALLAAASSAQNMRNAGRYGIGAREPEVDFAKVMDILRATQAEIEPHDSPATLRGEGVEVIQADAEFIGPGALRAGDQVLRFRSAIIATGSTPVVPLIPGLSDFDPLTTESVWELEALPPRLAIIGGGPVGCELGQAFSRLGSEVSIVEADDRLLAREEPDSSRLLEAALEEEGVDVRTGTEAAGFEVEGDQIRMRFSSEPAASDGWSGDRVLVAVGRAPRTSELGLDSVSVAVNDNGSIGVDQRMRTSAAGIFAVGDVTGGPLPFTHVAAQEARVAAPNALFGLRGKADYSAVPWATFTDPEIARVGISESEARRQWGERTRTVTLQYADLDRAIVEHRTDGFAKLVADRGGRLVGATIAGLGAGDAIAEMAAWISRGAKIDDISKQVHAYPTMAEGASWAANEYVADRLLTPRNRALIKPVLGLARLLGRISRDR